VKARNERRDLEDAAPLAVAPRIDGWSGVARGRTRPGRSVRGALVAAQSEQVLLHQDLHADNVLRAAREPWLAIDPKPLAGEREFGVAPILRAYELGHSRQQVIGRLHRLSGELGLDRERSRGWAFAQMLAWAFQGDEVLPRHVETARWLLGSA
jgi:streptomycin 6-kinase